MGTLGKKAIDALYSEFPKTITVFLQKRTVHGSLGSWDYFGIVKEQYKKAENSAVINKQFLEVWEIPAGAEFYLSI